MKYFEQGMKVLDGIRLGRGGTVRADLRNRQSLWAPHGFIFQRGTFTVPADVPDSRVQEIAATYRNKFGQLLEKEGFQVLGLDGPREDTGFVNMAVTDPDRRPYVIWAKVTRRPVAQTVRDVPDEDVAMFEAAGFKKV